ncbi:prenyltransferase/squalene oxidase repeat-containing protein [Kitasatospora purpeofusca]|uniref:prenyltransferase/squalene oxidase repeat-containing protein n=1 Tax=Kitasatospora purpeofusca TaxID=67352 RepID=UPI0037F1BF32
MSLPLNQHPHQHPHDGLDRQAPIERQARIERQTGIDRQTRLEGAVAASTGLLLATQLPTGAWTNPRPAAVSGTAGAALALHLAGTGADRALAEGGCAWLLRVRNPDGGWGTLEGFPSDVVATCMAAAALTLVPRPDPGDAAAREAVAGALAWLGAAGGVEAVADRTVRQLCSLVLALAGLGDAGGVSRVPVELVLLPAALRRKVLSYLSPPFVALALLQSRFGAPGPLARGALAAVRPAAVRLLGAVQYQEGDVGSYGGDPWLTGLVVTALASTGSVASPGSVALPGSGTSSGSGAEPDDARLVAAGLDYLRATVQPDGSWCMIHGMETARVEVTGPAFAAAALGTAGFADDPRLVRTRTWLADCQQTAPFPLYDCPPGGWTWSGPKGWPNVLDSLAVLEVLLQGDRDAPALRRGLDWLLARQDRRGSWSTFVRNTLVPLDGPCPYITAKALLVLHEAGVPASDPRLVRGLRWLLRRQDRDGGFRALWHRGVVPATVAVLRLLAALGRSRSPVARRALDRLRAAQLPDGSWSTGDRGEPGTVDETARAVLALAACGDGAGAERGADWLLEHQRPDGSWEPGRTCVYIRDHVHYSDFLMAQGLALSALAAVSALPAPSDLSGASEVSEPVAGAGTGDAR